MIINNLVELIQILEESYQKTTIENFKEIVKLYNGNDWRKFADHQKDFSKRYIYKSKNFEIVLICWKKDYQTKYHKHPNNGCVLKVLEGCLMENIKDDINNEKEEIIKMNIFINDSISFMHDNKGVHKITAMTDTFSLHIYSPPGFYDN